VSAPASLRRDDLLAFLPAREAIEAAPPRRAARVVAWSVCAFFAAAVLWACLARVDTVVVAPGRLVPESGVRILRAAAGGVVTRLPAREGARVGAGELLLALDDTEAAARIAVLEHEQAGLRADLRRLRTLLRCSVGIDAAAAAAAAADCAGGAADADPRTVQAWSAFRAELAAIGHELRRNGAARRGAEQRRGSLAAVLALLAERTRARQRMAEQGLGARARWLELEQQRLRAEQERQALASELQVLTAAGAGLQARAAALIARSRAEWHAGRRRAGERLGSLTGRLVEARHRREWHRLRAPVAGRVEGLAVRGAGAFVGRGEQVLRIVPAADRLFVEASLRNEDAGYVHPGQAARIKVAAFPFTRHGTLPGRVVRIGADTGEGPDGAPAYPLEVVLVQSRLEAGEHARPLAAGMAVTVEVATGRRRLIEFLMAPLLRYRDEAARER